MAKETDESNATSRPPNGLVFVSATRLLAALERRTVSSRELLAAFVSQIDRHNDRVNAVITMSLERAEVEASRADERRATGRPVGQLCGLPMTVKDAIETAGLISTGGSPLLRGHLPERDASAVARLRRAGAIVFGKTNVPEFSADSQTFNDLFGTTVNPHDPARTPGGSSGGSAAALASGMTPLELGTDLMGSIRIPASFCGIFGLKPTYGLVPQRGYLADASGGTRHDLPVNAFGPLARSAADLDLALGVLAGRRAALLGPPLSSPKHLRLGVCFADDCAPVDGEVEAALRATVQAVRAAGVAVDEVTFPVSLADSVELLFELVPPRDAARPTSATSRACRHNRSVARQRTVLLAGWEDFFSRYDALLCPVAPTAAFVHDQRSDRSQRVTLINDRPRPYLDGVSWTGGVGVVGLPAVAAPGGTTPTGLPVGAQIIARHGADRIAIGVAGLLERVTGGFRAPPALGDKAGGAPGRRNQAGDGTGPRGS